MSIWKPLIEKVLSRFPADFPMHRDVLVDEVMGMIVHKTPADRATREDDLSYYIAHECCTRDGWLEALSGPDGGIRRRAQPQAIKSLTLDCPCGIRRASCEYHR